MNFQKILRDWVVFGPIPNPGAYPGEKAWKSFAADGAVKTPRAITVTGRVYRPIRWTTGPETGLLDFREVFGQYPQGSPQAYAFCEFKVKNDLRVTLAIDLDWGAIVWLDGREVLDVRDGNGGNMGLFPRQTVVALTPGKHVLACRVISGLGGWKMALAAEGMPGKRAGWPKYSETGLRIEERPLPTGKIGQFPTEVYEKVMFACGVEARWISVVDQTKVTQTGDAVYKSKFLPTGKNYRGDFEENLKKWVKIIHDLGMPVMSWFPMAYCRQGWRDHPEWRQKYQVKPSPDSVNRKLSCCINSPFGRAVARFCAEAVRKFDLDGIWFDGAAFTPIWESRQPVSCWCEYCRRKYKKETGREIPSTFAPQTLEFRKWMAWRYKNFSGYWKELARVIKAAKPEAEIVVNHYHREHIGWNGAVPLNPFAADIISGTEADGDPWRGAFYTRVMRAYGKPRTEVWLWASRGKYRVNTRECHNPYQLITHAVACLTAGGDPSFGGVDPAVSAGVMTKLAQVIRARKPFRNLPAVPFAGLLISQQTDTFTFGTNPAFVCENWKDYYWRSLLGWDRMLMQAGVWTDVLFDAHITPHRLAQYKILFLPLMVALTDGQVHNLLDYVRKGGTVVAGPWFGTQDKWGFARTRSAEEERLFPYGRQFPGFDQLSEFFARSGTKSRIQKYGRGKIVQFAGDLGGTFRDKPGMKQIEAVWKLIERDRGGIPIVFTAPQGKEVFAHLGVFKVRGGGIVVALQQVPPFWETPGMNWVDREEPRLAAGCILKIYLPHIHQAQDVLTIPCLDLNVNNSGKYKEIELPPFTWGTVIRLT